MSVSPARGASPPPDRTVEDVQAEDAAFRRRAAEAPAPVPAAEGEALRARLDAYAPEVRRLAELEVEAQASFWSLKRKFAGA